VCFAADISFILSGGGRPDDNHKSFGESSKVAYTASKEMSLNTLVAYADGHLADLPSSDVVPATGLKDTVTAMTRQAFDLSKRGGGTMLVYIGNHGLPPMKKDDYLGGGAVLYTKSNKGDPQVISHRQFSQLFSQYPRNVRILLVGNYCFDGGLHEISFANENVCSVSSTDWRTVSLLPADKPTSFTETFWQEARAHKTLEQAGQEAIESHAENGMRGQVSSLAFVDKVLKTGSYDPSNAASWVSLFDWKFKLGTGKMENKPTMGKFYNLDEMTKDCLQKVRPESKVETLTAQLHEILNQLEPSEVIPDHLPEQNKNRYQRAIADWRKNRQEYLSRIRLLQLEYSKKKREDDSRSFFGQIWNLRASLQWELDFNARAEKKLKDYFKTVKILEEAAKIERFFKQATPEQKATFARLLKCEAQSL